MKRGLIALVTVVILCGCVASYLVVRRNGIERAYQAIGRADEYWDAGDLLFEPRYLEAEKAVANVGNFPDPLPAARLHACLANVSRARDYLKLVGDSEVGATAKESMLKFQRDATDCISAHR